MKQKLAVTVRFQVEVDTAKFEVDLNEGRLDQVGDVLQMNGGGLVRTPKSLLFIRSGAFGSVWSGSWRFVKFTWRANVPYRAF